MYCRNCGKTVDDKAVVCINCGVPVNTGRKYCNHCGEETNIDAVVCIKCGRSLTNPPLEGEKSKIAAGLLGIFLGGLGVHRFYLGYTGIGIAQIAVSFVTCGIGSIWGFIEGILILTGSMDKDAKGNSLKA